MKEGKGRKKISPYLFTMLMSVYLVIICSVSIFVDENVIKIISLVIPVSVAIYFALATYEQSKQDREKTSRQLDELIRLQKELLEEVRENNRQLGRINDLQARPAKGKSRIYSFLEYLFDIGRGE